MKVATIVLAALALGSPVLADVHGENLSAFEFGKQTWMKGLLQAPPTRYTFSAMEQEATTEASINRQFVHGSTELRYSVMRFRLAADALHWVATYASMCQAPVTCWRALPAGGYEMVPRRELYPKWPALAHARERPTAISARWKGPTGPVAPLPTMVIADRTVLVVATYQHRAATRPSAAPVERPFPDADLKQCAGRLVIEFTRAAMGQARAHAPVRRPRSASR